MKPSKNGVISLYFVFVLVISALLTACGEEATPTPNSSSAAPSPTIRYVSSTTGLGNQLPGTSLTPTSQAGGAGSGPTFVAVTRGIGPAPVTPGVDPTVKAQVEQINKNPPLTISGGCCITTLANSPDGKFLAVGYDDGSVRMWADNLQPLPSLIGHTRQIVTLVWSPDSRFLATASQDNTIKVWSNTGKLKGSVKALAGELRWSYDDKYLAIGAYGDTFTWSPDTGIEEGHTAEQGLMAWLPNSNQNQLAILPQNSKDNFLSIYSPRLRSDEGRGGGSKTGFSLNTQGSITALAFSPTDGLIAASAADGAITLWDTKGTLKGTLKGHAGKVTQLVWSPDGKILASGSEDNTIRLWSSDGTNIGRLSGHSQAIQVLRWTADSKLLASSSGENSIRIWSADGKSVAAISDKLDRINGLAWFMAGKALAVTTSGATIRFYGSDGKLLSTLPGHSYAISRLVWAADGKTLISIEGDSGAGFGWWNQDGSNSAILSKTSDNNAYSSELPSYAFSVDNNLLAYSWDTKTVKIVDNAGKEIASGSVSSKEKITSLGWSSDSKTLGVGTNSSANYDKTFLNLWDSNGKPLTTIPIQGYRLDQIRWSPNGSLIACLTDTEVILLDNAGKILVKIPGQGAKGILWSPDSKFIVFVGRAGLSLYEATGQKVITIPDEAASSVTWSPDSKVLATIRNDGVRLWQPDGSAIITLKDTSGEAGSPTHAAWSPDSKKLASVYSSGMVKIWNSDGSLVNTYRGVNTGITFVTWTPDGKMLTTGYKNGGIGLWQL